MKAIILIAGAGKRLAPLTHEIPKCLIPFEGKPLLQYYFESLKNLGIESIALVVGHLRGEVEAFAGTSWQGIPLRYYESPDTRGGSLLSLWSARGELAGEVLIMDGDVFFPEALLRRLTESKHTDCLLADPSSPVTGEEMNLYGENGRVYFISKKPYTKYPRIGESVGFLKLSKSAAAELAKILEDFVREGKKGIEHEETYPMLMTQCVIGCERVDDLKWTEIDSMEDLEKARKLGVTHLPQSPNPHQRALG